MFARQQQSRIPVRLEGERKEGRKEIGKEREERRRVEKEGGGEGKGRRENKEGKEKERRG